MPVQLDDAAELALFLLDEGLVDLVFEDARDGDEVVDVLPRGGLVEGIYEFFGAQWHDVTLMAKRLRELLEAAALAR